MKNMKTATNRKTTTPNTDGLTFSRKMVYKIQHFRNNLFLVKFDGCLPIVCDDVSLVINSSNYDDFKQPLLKFLRNKKLQKINDEDVYDNGEIIYNGENDDTDDYFGILDEDDDSLNSILNKLKQIK